MPPLELNAICYIAVIAFRFESSVATMIVTITHKPENYTLNTLRAGLRYICTWTSA